jgi:hypothetical protein
MVDPNVSYNKVHASRGKVIRAEPVAALYEQGRMGIEFLRGLIGLDIIAVDVNTVSPPHDVQNMTAFLAAQVLYESLVLLCQKPS